MAEAYGAGARSVAGPGSRNFLSTRRAIMTRDEMIDMLIPVFVDLGDTLTSARRRLWKMSTSALRRELILRELAEYDDPDWYEDEEADLDPRDSYSVPGWSGMPVYLD
jgi:hypothetical protein